MAQLELWKTNYEVGVYLLPKELDEKVARLHVEALGGKISKLSKDQAEYLGLNINGPYKPAHYRY
jgi:adenosylhomocysteinase